MLRRWFLVLALAMSCSRQSPPPVAIVGTPLPARTPVAGARFAKLDPAQEKAMAEEGLSEVLTEWPEY